MQTHLADFIRDTPEGREADAILRKCVHCGFCTATCPTYQLLGDELDGPRGRIYLVKQVLEGADVTARTQRHLDRCLGCRACETTCPSGVRYGRLADIGRAVVERKVARPAGERLVRWALRRVVAEPALFDPLLKLGQAVRAALPRPLRDKVPLERRQTSWAPLRHARRMLVLDGCVQPSIAPGINAAASRVLDRLGISLVRVPRAGCCGAVDYHLQAEDTARSRMRALIDAWWPHVEAGAEAIVVTASGCGMMVREYGHLLAGDPALAEKAQRISGMSRDLAEVLAAEQAALTELLRGASHDAGGPRVSFHSPCTLQHGLRVRGVVEDLLRKAGFVLAPVADAHLCCGSAGTYSVLQPQLSQQLRENKLQALHEGAPAVIATANIGCLAHLQAGTQTPVRHWIELLDEVLGGAAGDTGAEGGSAG